MTTSSAPTTRRLRTAAFAVAGAMCAGLILLPATGAFGSAAAATPAADQQTVPAAVATSTGAGSADFYAGDVAVARASGTVWFRAKADLNARSAPRLSARTVKVNAYRKGEYVPVVCQTTGGPAYGSTIWNKTTAGTYVVDAYVYTGTNGFSPRVPRCNALPKTTTPTTTPSTTPSGARSFVLRSALNGRREKLLHAQRVREYASGSSVKILCQAYGEYAYGSPIWDKTVDNLWIPDVYVRTGHDGFVPGMSRCDNDPKPKGSAAGINLNASQLAYAKQIIAVGKGYKIPRKGWIIAIATAMQESTLRNLGGGDRDSVGLFQQRPSTGWGSIRECTTPVLAIRAFYGVASHTNNPGLVDIRGWQSMSVTRAAQKVQRSAYPDAYAKWESLARKVVDAYGDEVAPQR